MRWIAALAGITTVQSDARTASYRLPDVSGRGSFENAFAPRSRRHIVTLARTYLTLNDIILYQFACVYYYERAGS